MAKKKPNTDVDFATKEFNVYFPFARKAAVACLDCGNLPCSCTESKDEEGKVITIEGYANFCGDLSNEYSTFVDHCGDVMVPAGFDLSVWNKNPQILWQHDRNYTIGKGLTATKQADGLLITAEIHEDAMEDEDFYKIEKGLVSMLSVGFRTQAGEFKEINGQDVFFITKALLYEVSVVSIPMNSESGFSVIKSFDGGNFYAGSIDFNPKPIPIGAVDKSLEEVETIMKLKLRDLLPEDKVKEFEALGLAAELDALKDVDTKSYIESLVAKRLEELKSELKEFVAETVKSAEPAGEPEGEAAGEEQKPEGEAASEGQAPEGEAAPDAEEEKSVDVDAVKSLSDVITKLKALAAEEK